MRSIWRLGRKHCMETGAHGLSNIAVDDPVEVSVLKKCLEDVLGSIEELDRLTRRRRQLVAEARPLLFVPQKSHLRPRRRRRMTPSPRR